LAVDHTASQTHGLLRTGFFFLICILKLIEHALILGNSVAHNLGLFNYGPQWNLHWLVFVDSNL